MRMKNEKAEEMEKKEGEVEERMVVGRSDRDTLDDRLREEPPLLPAKPPE